MNHHRTLSAALAAVIALSASPLLSGSLAAADAPLVPKAQSALVYDGALGYVKGIAPGTTVSDIAADFDGTLSVTDASGNPVPADGSVGTDYILTTSALSSPALLYGDLNRDAKVGAKDVSLMLKHSAGATAELSEAAFDVNLDGERNMKDAAQLMKYVTGWDVPLGYVGWTFDPDPVEAELEDYTLDLYFTDSTVRDDPAAPVQTEERSRLMRLAKNEAEACYVNLLSYMGHEGLNAALTDFTDKNGNALETELLFVDSMYIETTQVTVPDRLPPMQKDFSIAPGNAQAFMIKVRTASDSAAGLYRAVLTVTDADGNEVKKANVYAKVWDFALTVETHAKTAIGMGKFSIDSVHWGTDTFIADVTYENYYEFMLKNRLNPWCIPYDPSDERADRWLDDPRVNTVLIAGGYAGDAYNNMDDDSKIARIYDKFKSHPEWMEKAIFYIVDEPQIHHPNEDHRHHVEDVIDWEKRLDAVWPDSRVIVPLPVVEQYNLNGEIGDTLTLCANHTSVLCPSTVLFPPIEVTQGTQPLSYPSEGIYGKLTDRLDKWREEGKEIWWYTADNVPLPPMNNLDVDSSGMEMRVLWWQQYHENIEGYLTWASTDWGDTVKPNGYKLSGSEGILLYPGARYGINGPIACIRSEIARDSIEDYEYLWLYEQKFGRDAAMEIAEKVVTNTYTFETDYAVLDAVRTELGDALEEAYK